MRTTISKKTWDRAKDQYNDGITMPLINAASRDSMDVVGSFVARHSPKLKEAGMGTMEADIKTLGVLLAHCIQAIHDNMPEYYTREVITNIILDTYDMIHTQTTDEEVLGDSNKKRS